MHIIGVMLSLAVTEQISSAAAQEEYLPPHLEQQIVEAALTSKPYSPLTEWLMQLYQSLTSTPIATLSGHKR